MRKPMLMLSDAEARTVTFDARVTLAVALESNTMALKRLLLLV